MCHYQANLFSSSPIQGKTWGLWGLKLIQFGGVSLRKKPYRIMTPRMQAQGLEENVPEKVPEAPVSWASW